MDLSPLDSLGFWDESNAMMAAGVLAREVGLYERATELLERCIEVARGREDQGSFALGAVYLAGTYTLTGRLGAAGEVIDEAVPAVRRLLGPDMSTTRVFSRAANTSRLRGDFESALGYLAEARRAAERNDESWVTQSAAVQEALIARDRGDLDGAQRLLDDIEHQPGADYGALILQLLRFNQVGLALRRGDHVEAHQKLRDVLSDPELFTHYDTVEAVALSAVALSQVGRFDVAVRLLAAADRERERTGLVVQSPDRPILEEAVQQTRSGLGDSWESG
jgi:tetratricopeptide (TPR) repeat protein